MKVLVITSCTGEKAVTSERALLQEDFAAGPSHIAKRERELAAQLTAAEQLYTGQQHVRLMRGVNALRESAAARIELKLCILSAGYGLIDGARKLAPYECTFAGMKAGELKAWAHRLGVPEAMREVLAQPFDFALVLLGDDYLKACNLDDTLTPGGPTLLFCGGRMLGKLPKRRGVRAIPLSNVEAKRFSCGLVALKGELAARLLGQLANGSVAPGELCDPATDVLSLLDTSVKVVTTSRPKARANPKVDRVIQLPQSWGNKPHRDKLRYFIPEWDDLVDPDYDFENDIHSGGSGDWSNEVYAHQMYPEPNYDGLLISKVVAEKSKKKKARINELGVHRFLRVPRSFPVMGDCGAFGYIQMDVPPYTTDEMLDYYTRLDFDLGVSLDHLIVTATEASKKERYQLTIHNAEEFLREHRRRGLQWTPIGAVQGWDAQSYREAARQCVAMGYKYIALGGLVRTPTREILRVLEQVHDVVPATVATHLFGLARIGALGEFARLGVRSVDSASYLRRAWMGTGQNYLTEDAELFAAIRIPEAAKSFRAKRMVSEGRAALSSVQRLEDACMAAMHGFDQGTVSIESVLDTLMEYDHLITPDRPDNRALLEKTLVAAPWKACACDICRRDGIDVIIFRGNNRNRRRGFHNTYVFYRLVQRALAGEQVNLDRNPTPARDTRQADLFAPREVANA